MKNQVAFFLLVTSLFLPFCILAQTDTCCLKIAGTIFQQVENRTPLPDSRFVITTNEVVKSTYHADKLGNFKAELNFDNDYSIVFGDGVDGFETKTISISTKNVPIEERRNGAYHFRFDVNLNKLAVGTDPISLNKPIVKIGFDAEGHDFQSEVLE